MTNETQNKDYDSISPSAKALLLLKGHTDIPFAKQAAELISRPEIYKPDFSSRDFMMWARTAHLEMRYKSIDDLLAGLPATNILELSSGFSFRGLQTVQDNEVHYIDTDLPDVIRTKNLLIADLQKEPGDPKGTLELLPLNALDEDNFKATVARFPPGRLTIVNEGLLMYLDNEEKGKLCRIIRETLQQRGGCWITADIYVQSETGEFRLNDELQKFLDKHNIEKNKFESFEAAEDFFRAQGFVIDKEAKDKYETLSTIKYFMESISEQQKTMLGKTERVQATWRLKLASRE
jgi:O-methyltransferase involved in polyketide biosynthesis